MYEDLTERYSLKYNEYTDRDFEVFLYDYEVLTPSNEGYTEQTVIGRRGTLITNQKSFESVKIQCTFSVIHCRLKEKLRQIRRWLKGTGRLTFSDEPEFYYEVQKILYDSIERQIRKYGRFTVTFICYPYEFALDGDRSLKRYDLITNIYDEALPEYYIEGEGVCYLRVNDTQVRINVAQNVTIDTRRLICFRKDGTWVNTDMTGDYTGLVLKTGTNHIDITKGFQLKVYPHWGYEV